MHGYVWLCNSVYVSVTTWYFTCVYVHGVYVPGVIVL